MPAKGGNRITSYFPRITSRQTPGKRARQVDEADPVRRSSVKKSKSRQERNDGDFDCQPSTSTPSRTSPSSSRRSLKRTSRTVINIRETPPDSPANSASLRITTPPSSPLPELTPSPSPPRPRGPSYRHYACDAVNDNGHGTFFSTPAGASYPERHEVGLEIIPSSQTQNLDLFHIGSFVIPESPQRSSRDPKHHEPSRSSSCIPSSRPDATPLDFYTETDEFIASSQSQFMDLTPTSPIDLGFELVPSSQTQELCYFQTTCPTPPAKETPLASKPRTSFLDTYLDESQVPAQSSVRRCSPRRDIIPTRPQYNKAEPMLDEGTHGCAPAIPSSQALSSLSILSTSGSQVGEQLPSSQPSEILCNDELSSYGSLPNAVRDLQDMFSGTYESYPPDFPAYLR